MFKDPITIGIDEPFSRVWDILREKKIRHLPVVDPDGKIKGMITQRDLYRTVAPKKSVEEDGLFYNKEDLDKYILRHVMSKEIFSLSPYDTLGFVINAMVTKKFGCLPVMDTEGYLVGIITQIDVLRAISRFFL